MPDREKVIKGLECCKTYADCNKCPYNGGEQNCNSLRREALTLIKEQQNEIWEYQELNEYLQDKVKEQETTSTGKARIFQCEKCGYGIDDIYLSNEHDFDVYPHFCPNCGRTVTADA